ncbi:MAG: chorismate synthase, partial [Candidatus Omnitrophica bacterium]|nr:chorismate synthase [Candidatus Omnitrophota bacterium]
CGISVASKVINIAGEMSHGRMKARVEQARREKNTVGGVFEVVAKGVPAGLGSYAQYDRRIDAVIATQIMSIPGIKAMEIGLGFGYGLRFGSQCHDAIYYSKAAGYSRKTNNAGGIEGGVTNGEEIVLRACMKPISTLMEPLESVNIVTKRPAKAATERSDICAVEAAGVVAESALSFALAQAFLEKFGSDELTDIKKAYRDYLRRIS